jgi:hypothetical protein
VAADRPEKPLQHVVDMLAFAGEDGDGAEGEMDAGRRGSEEAEEEEEEESDELGPGLDSLEKEEPDGVGEITRGRLQSRAPPTINHARRPSISAECVNMHNSYGDKVRRCRLKR